MSGHTSAQSCELSAPQACDLIIEGGDVLTMDEPGLIRNGSVAIIGDEIVAVGSRDAVSADWQPHRRIDARGQAVVPGFVDSHVHLAGFVFAGGDYTPSQGSHSMPSDEKALVRMVANFCMGTIDPARTYAASRLAMAAMLRAGFTGVVDAGGFGFEGAARAAVEIGMRAAIGPSLADYWSPASGQPESLQRDTDEILSRTDEYVASWNGETGGRVRANVSIVDPIACSDELLEGVSKLVRDHDIPAHAHVNITADDVTAHKALFNERTPFERLAEANLCEPRVTAMHASYISDDEVRLIASSGMAVNHNPSGNALWGFGGAAQRAVPRLLAAGVPVSLGSDAPSGMVGSPFDLMRSALVLHRDAAVDAGALTLEQALAMGVNGGIPLGHPGRLGRIAEGCLADVVLVNTSAPHFFGGRHPVPALTLEAGTADVTTVVVAGKVLVEDGELVGVDEEELAREAGM